MNTLASSHPTNKHPCAVYLCCIHWLPSSHLGVWLRYKLLDSTISHLSHPLLYLILAPGYKHCSADNVFIHKRYEVILPSVEWVKVKYSLWYTINCSVLLIVLANLSLWLIYDRNACIRKTVCRGLDAIRDCCTLRDPQNTPSSGKVHCYKHYKRAASIWSQNITGMSKRPVEHGWDFAVGH